MDAYYDYEVEAAYQPTDNDYKDWGMHLQEQENKPTTPLVDRLSRDMDNPLWFPEFAPMDAIWMSYAIALEICFPDRKDDLYSPFYADSYFGKMQR